MNEIAATTEARRRLKRISEIRALFTYALGAAAGLAVLGLVRLISGQQDVFPVVVVPLLLIVGIAGERLTQGRYTGALEDLELAARNVARAEG